MPQQNNETRINLAIQALQRQPKSSVRAIAKTYEVDHRRLGERLRGIPPRRVISANSRKMTDLEEKVLVEHILDLAAKGFPPRLCVVEDMANRVLATRDGGRVGQRWARNFVRRQPEL
jgi:hypothetical protein